MAWTFTLNDPAFEESQKMSVVRKTSILQTALEIKPVEPAPDPSDEDWSGILNMDELFEDPRVLEGRFGCSYGSAPITLPFRTGPKK